MQFADDVIGLDRYGASAPIKVLQQQFGFTSEKLYEELLIDPAKSQPTKHPRIFSSIEPLPETASLRRELKLLSKAISDSELDSALNSMKRLVPEYCNGNAQNNY